MSNKNFKSNHSSGLVMQTVHGISYPRVGLKGIMQETKSSAQSSKPIK
ncbi:MAG: hypothetical protein ABJZ55_20820 [Fuerstiella sp.]